MEKIAINVAFVCDMNYFLPLQVMINSIIMHKNSSTIYHFYVLLPQEKNEDNIVLPKIELDDDLITMIQVNMEELNQLSKNVKEGICVATGSALIKFKLPDLLPECDKVLYLDVDMLVLSDLTEMYNIDLQDNYAAVVIDSGSIYYKHTYVKKVEKYFNSGVMLLNLKKMRKDNISKTLIETRKKIKDSLLMDQDVFNVIFNKRVLCLPIIYNLLIVNLVRASGKYSMKDINSTYNTEYKDMEELKKEAKIIHYSSKDKPWIYSDIPLADLWYEAYLKTDIKETIKRKNLNEISNDSIPSVSVIIPFFNVQKYIEQCVLSILKQSLSNIEIILVNDGSTDKSSQIVQYYSKNDKRITLINQENKGQSSARNRGLASAKGQYVYFLDSDDYLKMDGLYQLYKVANEKKVDVVFFDGECSYESVELQNEYFTFKNYYQRKNAYEEVTTGEDMYRKMIYKSDYKVSPCLQLIRREYLLENNIKFQEGVIHEDNYFSLRCILEAKKVTHYPEKLFCRRVRPNSIMTKEKDMKNFIGYYECITLIMKYVREQQYKREVVLIIYRQVAGYLSQLIEIYNHFTEEEKKYADEYVKENPMNLYSVYRAMKQLKDEYFHDLYVEKKMSEQRQQIRELQKLLDLKEQENGNLKNRIGKQDIKSTKIKKAWFARRKKK